jgi:hypothetical protein
MDNFDYWKNLAASSPTEFEIRRRETLQEFANKAPAAKRPALNALAHTLCVPQQGAPMERAINALALMSESLSYFHAGWAELAQVAQEASPVIHALLNDHLALSQRVNQRSVNP